MASSYCYLGLLLAVNILSLSLGNALPLTNTSIASSLAILSKTCGNDMLAFQIAQKLLECKVPAPPYGAKQAECLLFYDINKQLCKAVRESNLEVNDEAIEKLNAGVKIETVCSSALKWNISHLDDYPNYKARMDPIFKSPFSCGGACGGGPGALDVSEANFFCKYYNWGLQLLSSTATLAKPDLENTAAEVSGPVSADDKKPVIPANAVIPSANTVLQINPSNPESDVKPPVSVQESITKDHIVQAPKVSTQAQVPNINIDLSSDADIKVSKGQRIAPLGPIESKIENVEIPETNAENPEIGEDNLKTPEKKEDDKKIPQEDIKPEDPRSKISNYGDDDDNMEYARDDVDGFEPPKLIPEKTKPKPIVESGLTFNSELLAQKDVSANTFPEGYGDDGDNFFPVFLTGIVMVVLLYILYHNKSKVSKVVLGLIVEGRQTNRRRNSRGHAYRRLDTLEQAMNTNQSAPPSKIIY